MRLASSLLTILTALAIGGPVPDLPAQEAAPIYEAAHALLEEGKFPAALRAFELRLEASEEADFDDLMGAGRALYGLHEDNRATTLFSRALGRDRARPEPYAYLGRIAVRKADAKTRAGRDGAETDLLEALIHFKDAIKRTDEPIGYRREALGVCMTLEAWEEARVHAEAILKLAPDDEEASAARQAALFLEGRYTEFLAASDEVEDDDFLLRLRRLEAQARLNRSAETEKAFRSLTADFPNAWRPWDLLGRIWAEGSGLDRRIALFEATGAGWPKEAEPLPSYYLGYAYGQKGRFDDAVASYSRYLDRYPRNANALRLLSLSELGRGNTQRAHTIIREALVMYPEDLEMRTQAQRVVAAHVAGQDFEQALSLHQVIVAASPEDHELRRNEASLLKEVGRVEDAVVLMQGLLGREDLTAATRAAYLNDLALHLAGAGQREEARKCLREALEIDPTNPDAAENLGVFLFEAQRFDEAIEVLIRARDSEDPTSPRWRARYHLRRALRHRRSS
jgi:tetratricopeptide (TPR) repeat protein